MARTAPKDLSELREGEEAKSLLNNNHSYLKDYSGNHNVQIFWDMNEASKDDQIFILRIDGIEVYLDKQEMLRYMRNV